MLIGLVSMKSFKNFILFLHRWLGLITGIIVFILGITGCLFVFHQEISHWMRKDLLYINSIKEQTLPIKVLQQNGAEALGVEYLPYGITTYKNPRRTWSVMYYKGGAESWTYFGTIKDYRTLYINPYTGEVAGIVNEEEDFFQIVKGIHWSLLLATPIGQPIVTWSTVIFIIMLISGMILWWPKRWNKAGRQKSFKIKWGSSWRRVNYDLHNVLGFYFLIITLIIAFTGLYWYFPAAKKAMHFLGTGEFKLPSNSGQKVELKKEISPTPIIEKPLEIAYTSAWSKFPKAYSITIVAPFDSTDTIQANIRPDGETYYQNGVLYFDQNTAQLVAKNLYSEMNAGEKLVSMNYDIHVGAIGGLPGKIIAFFASLLSASLPVTGFIIWWDRNKRKRRREKKKRMSIQEIARIKKGRKKKRWSKVLSSLF